MFRLAVAIILLASVVIYASYQGPLLQQILSTPIWLLLSIIFIYLASQTLSAWKWKLILDALEEKKSFWECFKSYFLGMYINSFGLGIVGGDIIRALTINAKSNRTAIISVLFDRFHGFLVLAFIGGFAGIIYAPDWSIKTITLPILQISIFVVGILGMYFSYALKRIKSPRFEKWLEILSFAVSLNFKNFINVSIISAIFHLMQISTIYLFSVGYGIKLSPFHWLSVMPFVNIFSSLPISWNGVGLRESMLLIYLTPQPLEVTQVVNYSLIWLSAVIVGSLLGAVFGIFGNLKPIQRV